MLITELEMLIIGALITLLGIPACYGSYCLCRMSFRDNAVGEFCFLSIPVGLLSLLFTMTGILLSIGGIIAML